MTYPNDQDERLNSLHELRQRNRSIRVQRKRRSTLALWGVSVLAIAGCAYVYWDRTREPEVPNIQELINSGFHYKGDCPPGCDDIWHPPRPRSQD